MKYKTFNWLLQLICCTVVTACSKNADMPNAPTSLKKNGVVTGIVTDNRHLDDNNEETKAVIFGKNGYPGEAEYNIEFYVTE